MAAAGPRASFESSPGSADAGREAVWTPNPILRIALGLFGFAVPSCVVLLLELLLSFEERAAAGFLGIFLLECSAVLLWLLGGVADRMQSIVAGALMPGALLVAAVAWLWGTESLDPNASGGAWVAFFLIVGTALAHITVVAAALRSALRGGVRRALLESLLSALVVAAAFTAVLVVARHGSTRLD